MTTTLKLYNTLTRTKEVFNPIDPANVRMYVCGPTVYDFAHIGNARPVIVFDVLYRLLRHLYGENHVTYVRNITDVDDKINARALRDYPDLPLNEAIGKVTEKTANQFHADVKALGCLEPTHEPRATAHIDGMVKIINQLLANGNAYVAEGSEGREVLFAVGSMADYGQLSKRKLEDQQAGARIAVEAHKRNPGDFVLWKESAADQPGWQAAFTEGGETTAIFGRPGWHIECSAMSKFHLGETFDIHGGGLDLIFPHHENEIAQSRCAHGTDVMANVWMHNGFLQVEGRKMSKSEGNFFTIKQLLSTSDFGDRVWPGPVLKYAMLMKDYREPFDFTFEGLLEAYAELARVSTSVQLVKLPDGNWEEFENRLWKSAPIPTDEMLECLKDNLDTRSALLLLADRSRDLETTRDPYTAILLIHDLRFLGFVNKDTLPKFGASVSASNSGDAPISSLNKALNLVRRKKVAFINNENDLVESIEKELNELGFNESSYAKGSFDIVYVGNTGNGIDQLIGQRLAFLAAKDFANADRIRNELLEQGIQLKDSKDPETGERVTTWEVKR